MKQIYESTHSIVYHTITKGDNKPTSKPEMSVEDNSPFIHHLQFLHDRVQQAAYALIADKDKKAVHLKIGRLLLTNNSEKRIQFDIVDHLNIGQALITNEEEQIELARLNLEAGRKAKEATAYAAALQYLNAGMKCLGMAQEITDTKRNPVFSKNGVSHHSLNDNSWKKHYDLTFNLYKEKGEVEFLNANFDNLKN